MRGRDRVVKKRGRESGKDERERERERERKC